MRFTPIIKVHGTLPCDLDVIENLFQTLIPDASIISGELRPDWDGTGPRPIFVTCSGDPAEQATKELLHAAQAHVGRILTCDCMADRYALSMPKPPAEATATPIAEGNVILLFPRTEQEPKAA